MTSSIASTLKPELAEALSALFSKLDSTAQGSISLEDLRRNWEQEQGSGGGDDETTKALTSNIQSGVCSLKHEKVLQSIEKFAVEGRLSYERLCCGIKLSLIEEMIEKDNRGISGEEKDTNAYSTSNSTAGVTDKRERKESRKEKEKEETDDKNTSSSSLSDWKKRFFSSTNNTQELQLSSSSPSLAFLVNGKQENNLNLSQEKNSGGGDRKEKTAGGDGAVMTSQSHDKMSSSLGGKTRGEEKGQERLREDERMPSGYKELLYNHKWSAAHSSNDEAKNKDKKQSTTEEVPGSVSSCAVEKTSSSGYWTSSISEDKNRVPTLVSSIPDEASSSSVWSSAKLLSSLESPGTHEKTPVSASSTESSSRPITGSGKSLKWKENEMEDVKSKHQKSWREDRVDLGYENIKFSSSEEQQKNTKLSSLDVSTYSVNDKSLLTQSFMENFGYHPPRELSPVNLQLPQYNLPSTILNGISSDQLKHDQQITTKSTAYDPDDFKNQVLEKTEEGSFNSKWCLTSKKTDFEYQNGTKHHAHRDLDVTRTSFSEKNSETDNNSSKTLVHNHDDDDHDFLAKAQMEIKRFETKLNLELPVRRPASSNSSSTYTVKNSRSPIPPVSRNAYYELNDASDDDDKPYNGPTVGAESQSSKTTLMKSLEQPASKITLSSTPYKNVDPSSRVSLEESRRTADDYENRQKQKRANVIGAEDMKGNSQQDSRPRENKSSLPASKYYNVQSHDSSSFAISAAAAHSQTEKMDKMLDQALRAVSESYRLIRIGKKNLRRRSDSTSTGAHVTHSRSHSPRSSASSNASPNINNQLNESSFDGTTAADAINSEKYLRLMNSVLELHKALLDMIDTTNGEMPADLGDGEESCSQCGVCTTCQRNLQTFQLAVDQLGLRNNNYYRTTSHSNSLHNRMCATTSNTPLNTPRIMRSYTSLAAGDSGTSHHYEQPYK